MFGSFTTGFTPQNIKGLQGWYDSSDLLTITKDGSDLVSQWNNKANSTGHATATLLQRPTWTNTGISFNGSSNYMDLTIPNDWGLGIHIFIVTNKVNNTGEQEFLSRPAGLSDELRCENGGQLRAAFIRGGVGAVQTTETVPLAVNTLLQGAYNNTTMLAQINPAAPSTASFTGVMSNTSTGWTLASRGAGLLLNGKILEVLVYNKTLDLPEKTKIESYLKTRWGL